MGPSSREEKATKAIEEQELSQAEIQQTKTYGAGSVWKNTVGTRVSLVYLVDLVRFVYLVGLAIWFLWSLWFIWFIRLIWRNQMNKTGS